MGDGQHADNGIADRAQHAHESDQELCRVPQDDTVDRSAMRAFPRCVTAFHLCTVRRADRRTGIFLTSWTFIGDGNPDMLREGVNQINFNKRQKAAELIQQIQLHQSTPYNLSDVLPIQHYLEAAFVTDRDDQVFYSMSLQIEPKERDDDRIARCSSLALPLHDMDADPRAVLSESGFLVCVFPSSVLAGADTLSSETCLSGSNPGTGECVVEEVSLLSGDASEKHHRPHAQI